MKNLPKIALGTWSWGVGTFGGDAVFGQTLTEAQMKEVFDTAMKAGLNLWTPPMCTAWANPKKHWANSPANSPKAA